MQNIVKFEKNRIKNSPRLDLKSAADYLGMGYSQLRKIVIELNLIPYRNDGLGKYQKPSILVEDLDKYDKENTIQRKEVKRAC